MNSYKTEPMKSIYLVLLLLIGFRAFSQQQPYPYQIEVKYKMRSQPDSTDKQNIKEEFVSLLIGDAQSLFCATNYLIVDSAIRAETLKGNSLGPSMEFLLANRTRSTLVVFKDSKNIIAYERMAGFIFPATIHYYQEPKSQFGWKILEDTLSIGGIPCQKATADFGGRKWEAWFAASIPISEGPYKFNGLPGLILKVNDSQGYWNFDLASIQSINKNLQVYFSNYKVQPIKDKETYLSKKRYTHDNKFQLMKVQEGITFKDPVALMKRFEAAAKKDNNWIEPYKGK